MIKNQPKIENKKHPNLDSDDPNPESEYRFEAMPNQIVSESEIQKEPCNGPDRNLSTKIILQVNLQK